MIHTAETKRKLSDMRRGALNPFYGRKHTPETRAKLAAHLRFCQSTRTYEPMPQRVVIPGPFDVAYLAGMIDADGSIRFRRGRPFVSVYNTYRPLIEWLMVTLRHGCVSKTTRGRLQVEAWTITAARDVYALLTAIRPHLKVKAADADAAIAHLVKKYPELKPQ